VKAPPAQLASATKIRQRDRQATEDELVAAAAVAFAERGYEKATTRSIAEAAGCSEGLIQRYFNGKEGLLLAVLKQQGSERRDQFFGRPLCASMEQEAREMMLHGISVLAERSERLRIVFSRVLLDRTFQSDFHQISTRPHIQKALKKRLLRYVEAGIADPGLDMDVMTELLLSLIFQLGFVHRELLQMGQAEIDKLINGFAVFFARGTAIIPLDKRETPKRCKQT
jgi:AcrR family transcriptional regulator